MLTGMFEPAGPVARGAWIRLNVRYHAAFAAG